MSTVSLLSGVLTLARLRTLDVRGGDGDCDLNTPSGPLGLLLRCDAVFSVFRRPAESLQPRSACSAFSVLESFGHLAT